MVRPCTSTSVVVQHAASLTVLQPSLPPGAKHGSLPVAIGHYASSGAADPSTRLPTMHVLELCDPKATGGLFRQITLLLA